MANGSENSSSSRSPSRTCLGCGYPLSPSVHFHCPECGRGFNPSDRTTYASTQGRGRSYRVGGLIGALCVPVVFLCLYSVQYAVMGWWHDTSAWCWWNASRHGAWWELNGLGNWLWSVQMVNLAVHAFTSGILISRITIVRNPSMTG